MDKRQRDRSNTLLKSEDREDAENESLFEKEQKLFQIHIYSQLQFLEEESCKHKSLITRKGASWLNRILSKLLHKYIHICIHICEYVYNNLTTPS